jgi:hypothetical protein
MSSLHGDAELDLSKGFELHAVLKLNPQLREGRKVIFETGPLLGGPRFTVALDDANNPILLATDVAGNEHVCGPVPGQDFATSAYLACACCPADAGVARLAIFVNGAERATAKVLADLGGRIKALVSVGTDVRGEHAAAFELVEIATYERCLSQSDRARLAGYFRARYGL